MSPTLRRRLFYGLTAVTLATALWHGGQALKIIAKAELAKVLIATAWQQSLATHQPVKPWPWADTWPVARLQVPGMDKDLYILAGAYGSALAFGPGYVASTALPGLGTSVVGGHRDTHFRFLKSLAAGSDLRLQDATGRWHHYRTGRPVIMNVERSVLRTDPDADQLVLVTCYPFDALRAGGPLRYVVFADPVT